MPAMKSHLVCKWLCTSWSLFELLIYVLWNPGSEWLHTFCSLFELLTCLLWNPTQFVSGYAPPSPNLNCWHTYYEISFREWACTFCSWFQLLTCRPWNAIQGVSCCVLPQFYWITDMPPMKFRQWVTVYLLVFIWITDLPTMKRSPACKWLCTS